MGRQLCKLNGVGVKRKASRRGSGAKNEDKEDGFGCILDNVGVHAKRNSCLARYADAVALPGLSLLQISWFREFSCPPSAFLSCLLLMRLPYGLENRLEEATVFV